MLGWSQGCVTVASLLCSVAPLGTATWAERHGHLSFHSAIESLELEGAPKGHLLQLPCDDQGLFPPLKPTLSPCHGRIPSRPPWEVLGGSYRQRRDHREIFIKQK